MGNRANYVFIKNGQKQIFFSRWGAPTIPAVLLSGPEETLKYIRELEPDDALMTNVFAEGGILYNADERRVLFWGGDYIAGLPYLRRPLLKLLPVLWQGWSIDWAMYGVADLAHALGWDVWEVLKDMPDDAAFLTGGGPVIEALHIQQETDMLISVRSKTGEVRDYRVSPDENFDDSLFYLARPYLLLSHGPELLSLLAIQPTAPLPKEGRNQEPGSSAFIDEETHTLWVWHHEILDPRYQESLARRWPGWQVKGHVEGLVRHVSLTGRDATDLMYPEQQAIEELVSELTAHQGFDPIQLAHKIQDTLPAKDLEGVQFGMGFFKSDVPPLSPQERHAIILNLLAKLGKGSDTSAK